MVNSNVNALGVIFANTYDNLVPELVAERSMASIPFGGRYRLIDFTLSSMANAGIDNVSVIVRKNYHSLMDHLGAGREWDLTRKRGGLNIVPPFAERSVKLYSGRVDALESILNWLEDQKERYVILSDRYDVSRRDLFDRLDDQIRPRDHQFVMQGSCALVRPDRDTAPAQDISFVYLVVQHKGSDAALRLAVDNRPVDRRGPPVLRQQRRMQVKRPQRRHRPNNLGQHPESDHDSQVGPQRPERLDELRIFQFFGLQNRQPDFHGIPLDGRLLQM